MYQFLGLVLLLIKSTSCVDFDNLSEEAQFNEHHFAAFKHFGEKVTLGQKPIPLSLTLNSNLEHSFEHNLIAPKPEVHHQVELPHDFSLFTPHGASGQPGVRYTTTPVETYKVTEEVYEPKPIPQVVRTPGKPSLVLGSGSLGVVNLGHGKYALGSGSLGYSRPVAQQLNNKPEGGGLHVVPPPQLGSSEAFDAAFNNFDFKPLHQFFGH